MRSRFVRRAAVLLPANLSAGRKLEIAVLITVTLVDPDQGRSMVAISEDTTVRDVATSVCHLFWRTLKRNGTPVPFTAKVMDGDIVTVEADRIDES